MYYIQSKSDTSPRTNNLQAGGGAGDASWNRAAERVALQVQRVERHFRKLTGNRSAHITIPGVPKVKYSVAQLGRDEASVWVVRDFKRR